MKKKNWKYEKSTELRFIGQSDEKISQSDSLFSAKYKGYVFYRGKSNQRTTNNQVSM